jgi:protein gp37
VAEPARPAAALEASTDDLRELDERSFHERIPESFIRQVFEVMEEASQHTFQILTKRHERLAELAPTLSWAPNVWMGVTIENRRFVHRADYLREVDAAVRFISAEPLLGPLEGLDLSGIDWLIAGGESGAKHRRCDAAWIRDLRARCAEEDVAFFLSSGEVARRRRGADCSMTEHTTLCRRRPIVRGTAS